MATATYAYSLSRADYEGRWFDIHNVLLGVCIIALIMRFYTVFLGGGWADRGQFFGEGELRPSIIDFVYNEILVSYLVIRVIIFRYNPIVYGVIVLSAFAYFTRLPLVLLFFAIFFAKYVSFKAKMWLLASVLSLSVVILYIRFGEGLLYGDTSAIFYLTYPLIGIGRLIGTSQQYDVTAFQYISLFLKPVDAILFVIDYVWRFNGELSTGRHVGIELTQFVYIQQLQGAYNAFGTVLYPFVRMAGWTVGIMMFFLFIVLQYLQYRFATQNELLSRRYIYLLLTTGLLFSWTSPFVWLAPFFFTKFKNRRTSGRAAATV